MSGALASIRYFYQQGFKIGIVTGAGKEGVNSSIKHHQLAQYISIVVCSDDVLHSKPAPDCYLLAAQKLSLQPEQCLAIEDTYNGSLSASNAGIKCIGVSLSDNVLAHFKDTVFQCKNLNIARQWISKNYPYQNI
jgi:beta-phosphoglucomutase-like phosphatase (HAD superfamily)